MFPVVSNNMLAVSNYNGVPFTLRFCAIAKKSDDSDCSQFSISWFSTNIECEKTIIYSAGIASLAVTGALVSKGYSTVIIFQEMPSVIT